MKVRTSTASGWERISHGTNEGRYQNFLSDLRMQVLSDFTHTNRRVRSYASLKYKSQLVMS